MRIPICLTVFSAGLLAQGIEFNPFGVVSKFDIYGPAGQLRSATIATLPSSPATNTVRIVTDATGVNCTTGGGSTVVLCRWNGSAWAALGDGNTAGTPSFADVTAGTNPAALVVGATGSLNLSASLFFKSKTGSGPPPPTACDQVEEVGDEYTNSDETAGERKKYFCIATDTATYEWLAFQQAVGINSKPGSGSEVPGSTMGYVTALADGDVLTYQTTGTRWVNRQLAGTANEITMTVASGQPVFSIAAAFDISGKTSTKPVKTGTTAPATCAVGELFYDTDATAGRNLFGCTSTNTWTNLGDGASGSGCTTAGSNNQIVTDDGAGGCVSEPQWTIASNVLTSGASGKVDLSAAPGTDGLKVPVAAGAAPTADGAIAFDSTANALKIGESGTTYTLWSVAAGAGLSASDSGAQRTVSVDTAVMLSQATAQAATPWRWNATGGTDSYSASTSPTLTAFAATIFGLLVPDINNTGAACIDPDAGGPLTCKSIKLADGSTDPANGDIVSGSPLMLIADNDITTTGVFRTAPAILTAGNVRGTLGAANGGTNLTASADDNVMVGNGTTWQTKAIADCDDTGGNHLNYDTATNAFSCGTSGGGGLSGLTTNGVLYATGTTTATSGDRFTFTHSSNIVTTKILAGTSQAGNKIFDVRNDADSASYLTVRSEGNGVRIRDQLADENTDGANFIVVLNSGRTIVGDSGSYEFRASGSPSVAMRLRSAGLMEVDSTTAIGTTVGNARHLMLGKTYMAEQTADPSAADLTIAGSDTLDVVGAYVKNNKLVFAYNNAGTVTYITIPLDGTTATWTHSTTAP